MQQTWIRKLTLCAVVAAIYAVVTILTSSISYGPVQFRLSEALCVLPLFLPFTGWGLALGCLIANLFSTVTVLDIVIGTAATAIGCLMLARCRTTWMAILAPVLCNGVLVGAMLAWVLFPEDLLRGFAICAAEVAVGELAVMLVLGLPLIYLLRRTHALDRWQSLSGPQAAKD